MTADTTPSDNENTRANNTAASTSGTRKRKARSKTSIVWSYFVKIDGANYVQCKECPLKLPFVSSTSGLLEHLRDSHAITKQSIGFEKRSADRLLLDQTDSSEDDCEQADPKVKKTKSHECVLQFLVATNQSLRIVEHPAFRALLAHFAPKYKVPSRQTVSKVLVPQAVNSVIQFVFAFFSCNLYYFIFVF